MHVLVGYMNLVLVLKYHCYIHLCLAFVLKQINVGCLMDQCCELLDMFLFVFLSFYKRKSVLKANK